LIVIAEDVSFNSLILLKSHVYLL